MSAFLGLCLGASAQTAVTIPDPSLEAALRRTLNKPSGDLLDTELAGIQQFFAMNPAKNGRLNGYHKAGATLLNVSGFTTLINGSPVRIVGDTTAYTLVSHAADFTTITITPGLSAAIPATSSGTQVNIGGVNPVGIVDLTGIGYCTSLRVLDLTGNSITNLTPLVGLPSLTHIFLTDNQVVDLTPLTGITTLRGISLANNKVVSLAPLVGHLPNLTKLDLWRNKLTDISPLAGLTTLVWLDLRENQISDTTALKSLTNLTGLALDNNPIGTEGFSNLQVLTKLERLAVNFTGLGSLPGVQYLINLHMLAAGGNTIHDFSRLVANPGIQDGDYVFVGTVLGPPTDCGNIAILRARGVIVDDLGACGAIDRTTDRDGDGIADYDEVRYYSDPTNADTDGDGMPDGWEVRYGLNPINPYDALLDSDGDGKTNLQEYLDGTNPNDPLIVSGIVVTPSTGVVPLAYPLVTMEVQVVGANGPLTYLWKKNGAGITEPNVTGITGPILTFTDIVDANEGLYRCTVTNLAGTAVYAEKNLYVGALVSFTTQPKSQKKYYGDNVEVHIVATGGRPPLHYQWYREVGGVSTATGGDSNTLMLGHVSAADAGAYYCVVTDQRGPYPSTKATLSLAAHVAVIVPLPTTDTVPAGSNYALRLQTTGGFQPVTYDWQFNGFPIEPTATYSDGGVLVLHDFQADYAGVYTVYISDNNTDILPVQMCTLAVGPPMPAAGLAGLIAAAGAMATASAAFLRRRRR